MNLDKISDHSILRMYNNIRVQLYADAASGSSHRFVGRAAREEAERLRGEIDRRGLFCEPID